MAETYQVTVSSGSLRSSSDLVFPHRWTEGGVTVDTTFTGAHLLHLAVAGCVLNDLHREAAPRGIMLNGARVTASGGFAEDWASTGIGYSVELDSDADPAILSELVTRVDQLAEIPRALRSGTTVARR